jgi:SNF2 family DNA or RNA helicase
MTGSPVTKNPLDLYSQCEFLSPWLLNFQSFYAFRNRYAEMKTINARGRSIQVVNYFKNIGELSDKLKGFSYRVLKEDCLDLPDKIYIKRNVSLTAEQSKEYGEESVVDYYGLTPQEDRQNNIQRFQNDPECRFILGTPQTGGYGITLTAANTVIYYSNGYDLEKRLQSEDRAHRIGQKKAVTYVDLMAEKTVDEKIVKALRKKINIASEVLGEELRDWI